MRHNNLARWFVTSFVMGALIGIGGPAGAGVATSDWYRWGVGTDAAIYIGYYHKNRAIIDSDSNLARVELRSEKKVLSGGSTPYEARPRVAGDLGAQARAYSDADPNNACKISIWRYNDKSTATHHSVAQNVRQACGRGPVRAYGVTRQMVDGSFRDFVSLGSGYQNF